TRRACGRRRAVRGSCFRNTRGQVGWCPTRSSRRREAPRTKRRATTHPVDTLRAESEVSTPNTQATQRYREAVWKAAEEFVDLKVVRKRMRCSSGLVHRIVYEQLELRRRTRLYAWPNKIGIDEHFFRRNKSLDERQFVSMIVDHSNHR